MRKTCLIACVLTILIATSCRPAAAPVVLPTPTDVAPVVGTALPGESGALPVPPPVSTTAPEAIHTPSPTTELIQTGSSGVHLSATIGPTCPGPERPGQVCTQPYEGLFVVTDGNGAEVARATTDSNGQVTIDLPPGTYTIVPKVEGRWPSGAPAAVIVPAGQYVEVHIELDSGIR